MMYREFANRCVEYMDQIDLMDYPSNVEIGLWRYKK